MWNYPHKSIFTRLPLELVDEIARYSEPRELQTLCLVSRRTGDVATRRLYHTIVLEKKNALQCFRTLTQRQDVANCVRRMAIDVSTHNLFENFFQLAAAALKQTTNLIGLDISGLCPLLSLLAETHFPRLIEVKIPYGPAVTPFLQTNRQHLKAIVIEGPPTPDSLELSSRHFTNVQLPELIAFIGPCNVIPHVIPGSQVQYLTICWEPGCERRLEEIVRGVAQSRNEVLGMDNLVLGWNPGLLSVIAECVPGMERLRIRNICPLTSREMIESYLLYLEDGLHKFHQLHTLAITLLFNPYEYNLTDLDYENDLLRRWGTVLPTLTVCTLPSMTRWMRFKDNVWIPIVDPKVDPHRKLKIHWLLRAFKNGIYPSELFVTISGGIKFEDVEAFVDTGYFLDDAEGDDGDDDDGVDPAWDWEDGEDTEEDSELSDEDDDDGMSDWGSNAEEGDSDWESGREEDNVT